MERTASPARPDALDLMSQFPGVRAPFQGRDHYSMSERRSCVRWMPDEALEFDAELVAPPPEGFRLELVAMPAVFADHRYVHKFLNGLIVIAVNGAAVHDRMIHWRTHEETASFWQRLSFSLPAAAFRAGLNRIRIVNRTSKVRLGMYYDERLDNEGGEALLSTWYLADAVLVRERPPQPMPALTGVPRTAVAGEEFLCEVAVRQKEAVEVETAENAAITIEPAEWEFQAFRAVVRVCPMEAGRPVSFRLRAGQEVLTGRVEQVYAPVERRNLAVGGGIESLKWDELPSALEDVFAHGHGNSVRISIDDFLNDFHAHPVEDWQPLVRYLSRRGLRFAAQRLRVPPYSRISHEELSRLASAFGANYLGTAIPEPAHHMGKPGPERSLRDVLEEYLAYFRGELERVRLPGFPVVTFDAGSALAGHYYAEGLDVHLAETGPACNVYEEICSRGAASAWHKPWGIVAAMLWYYGQGSQYACDDSRVRLARLVAFSAYLSGAAQILWEGGVFDNLPVYQYALTSESWTDYERRIDHPALCGIRRNMADLLDFDRAQQLPPPRISCAFLQGENDLFHGLYDPGLSPMGELSLARSWRMLTVFYPHIGARRGRSPHDGPMRRWFSWSPYGQADVTPARSPAGAFGKYRLLVLAGWNTMTEDLHGRLRDYVSDGGTLLLSLPHLTCGETPALDWKPFRGGDFRELCGIRLRGPGGPIRSIHARRNIPGIPAEFTLAEKAPLFPEDFDESYPVFGHDISYLAGDIETEGASVLAASQSGNPVLLEHRVGTGRVILANTWFLPGRGRQLDYARTVLRALVAEDPGQPRLDDPSERIAWWEYPAAGCRRFVFLNTDWAAESAVSEITFHLGTQALHVPVGHPDPVQLYWDGSTAAVLRDPTVQILKWTPDTQGPAVCLTGRRTASLETLAGPPPRIEARSA